MPYHIGVIGKWNKTVHANEQKNTAVCLLPNSLRVFQGIWKYYGRDSYCWEELNYNEIRKVKTICLPLFLPKHEMCSYCRSVSSACFKTNGVLQHRLTGVQEADPNIIWKDILSIFWFRQVTGFVAFIAKACLCILYEYNERKLTVHSVPITRRLL